MQEEIENSSKTTHVNFRDLPGMSVTEILTNMPEGDEESGYFVPYKDANNVKSMMTKVKEKSAMVFQSAITDGGIIVWKKSNNINQIVD